MDKETLRELKKELDWWWNPGRLWCMERALETARDVMGDETLEDAGLTASLADGEGEIFYSLLWRGGRREAVAPLVFLRHGGRAYLRGKKETA